MKPRLRAPSPAARLALVLLIVASLGLAACGSSRPKETHKHAQAAVAKQYANLVHVLATKRVDRYRHDFGPEERATDKLIASVKEHRPALGLREAKRSLAATAYTMQKVGDKCTFCQQKLKASAQTLK
jgi:hypothetical protein